MTYFRHLQYVILNCCQATSALAKGVFCTRRTNRVHMRTCPGYLSRLQRTLMTYGPQNDSIVWICLGYRQLCFKEKGKQRGADLRKTVHNPSHAVQQKLRTQGGKPYWLKQDITFRIGSGNDQVESRRKPNIQLHHTGCRVARWCLLSRNSATIMFGVYQTSSKIPHCVQIM